MNGVIRTAVISSPAVSWRSPTLPIWPWARHARHRSGTARAEVRIVLVVSQQVYTVRMKRLWAFGAQSGEVVAEVERALVDGGSRLAE